MGPAMVRKVGYELMLFVISLGIGGMLSAFTQSTPAKLALGLMPYAGFLAFRVLYSRATNRSVIEGIIAWETRRREEKLSRAQKLASAPPSRLDLVWASCWRAAGILLALYGALLFGAQLLYWLQHDVWVSVALLDLFMPRRLGEQTPFVLSMVPDFLEHRQFENYALNPHPDTWMGVRRLVLGILRCPLALASIVIGWAVSAIAAGEAERIRRELSEVSKPAQD